MRKYVVVLLVLAVAAAISCKGGQGVGDPNSMFVSASNQSLAKIPMEGFGYKSSTLPPQEWDKWATAAAPVVKEIITKLPDGYVLQVTGHADSRGPEERVGAKPGNLKISDDRAKVVFNSLKKKGIDSPKMTYKGIGSSETTGECGSTDPCQRRVTFKVVPKK